ncbi:DnaJ domain-containing protein [Candidatus Vidania fulgoroideorum]
MYKDYYKILGINKNASDAEIKRAYRKLAMKYHPDKNPDDKNAEEKFKEIKNAYENLTNKNKNDEYNQDNFTDVEGNFEDIFENFFEDEEEEEENSDEIYKDIFLDINLTLEQIDKGIIYNDNINIWKMCDYCNGNCYIYNNKIGICEYCNGSGSFRISKGFFNIKQFCKFCNGTGRSNIKKCNFCYFKGKIKIKKKISIKIPKGILNGTKIKLNLRSVYNVEKKIYSNIYLKIVIINKKKLYLDKNHNTNYLIKVFFIDALLGNILNINILNRKIKLKIPKCIQEKKIFIKNKGIYNISKKTNGVLILHIKIIFPKNLNKKQEKILKKLKNTF